MTSNATQTQALSATQKKERLEAAMLSYSMEYIFLQGYLLQEVRSGGLNNTIQLMRFIDEEDPTKTLLLMKKELDDWSLYQLFSEFELPYSQLELSGFGATLVLHSLVDVEVYEKHGSFLDTLYEEVFKSQATIELLGMGDLSMETNLYLKKGGRVVQPSLSLDAVKEIAVKRKKRIDARLQSNKFRHTFQVQRLKNIKGFKRAQGPISITRTKSNPLVYRVEADGKTPQEFVITYKKLLSDQEKKQAMDAVMSKVMKRAHDNRGYK